MADRTPMPPPKSPLYVPLEFWMDVIAYLDKRIELVANGSGHGQLEMTIKLHKGRVFEVNFGEQIRVRDIVEKTGHAGTTNPQQLPSNKEKPITEAE